MGDLVVGARSGSGEPEKRGTASERAQPETAEASDTSAASIADGGVRDRPSQAPPTGSSDASSDGPDQDKPDQDKGEKKPRPFWKELPILILVALVLALLIKTFFVQAFSIPSGSMQNTLQIGDRVLVDKLTPWFGAKPQRGEVVVFQDPGGWLDETATKSNVIQTTLSFIGLMPSAQEKDLIKRVIAVGGDRVECSGTGPVKVNGKALNEPYIFPGATPCADHPFGPVKVPEGRIWVMGDHRNSSSDSRYHQDLPGHGTLDEDQVVGRAFVVAWPAGRWHGLPVPGTFDQPGLASAGAAPAPALLGLAGAVPITLLNRRRLLRRAARGSLVRRNGHKTQGPDQAT